MVYKYQEEGVLFDNVRSASSFLSGLPLGNDKVYNDAQDGDYVTRKYSIRDIGSIVNALDIDWNGAHVNNIENYNIEILNTTSDLLKWIKHLEYRISILENNGSRPGDSEEYSTITWDDNGATSPHSGGSTTTVRNGNPIIIPTTNPKREYTITWNANGGTGVLESTKVTYGFKGWYTSRLGGSPLASNTIANGDATYYAHWTAPTSITLPTTNPTRNGYNFIGWATTSVATTSNVNENTIPTSDVTYYAVWQEQSQPVSQYDITFNANGGKYSDNTTSKTIKITRGEYLGSNIPVPTKEGYDYQGYADTSTANKSNIGPTTQPQSDNTYYAVWKRKSYNVTLNVNGGTAEGTNPVSTSHGSSAWFTIVPNAGYSEPITVDRNNNINVGSDSVSVEKNTTTGKYAVNVKNVTKNTTVNISFTAIPVINLNPSSDTTITEPITVTSTVNGVPADTNWAITNEGTSGETFNKSTFIGASVTITPNDMSAPEANKGTVSMTTGSPSQSTSNGAIALNALFAPGQNSTKEYSTTLTASYDRAEPVSIDITFSKTTNALSAGTYTWSVEGTLPSGVQLIRDGAFASLENTNSESKTIPINTIKVENANGTKPAYNTEIITVPGKSETNTYYWYIGSTDPSTMTSISPIVANDDMSSPGWREIGTTLPTYSSSNMLWNGDTNNISFGGRTEYYIALPNNLLKLYNVLGGNEMDGCTSLGTKVINSVTYYIYKRNVKAAAFAFNIY